MQLDPDSQPLKWRESWRVLLFHSFFPLLIWGLAPLPQVGDRKEALGIRQGRWPSLHFAACGCCPLCWSRLCLWPAAGSAHPRSLLPDSGALPVAGPFLTPLSRWRTPLTPWQPSGLGICKMARVRLYNMVFVWLPGNSLDLASPNRGYVGFFPGVPSFPFYLPSVLSSSLLLWRTQGKSANHLS